MSLKKNKIKVKRSKSSFLRNPKASRIFIFNVVLVISSIAIFSIIIYKAYNHAYNRVDIAYITLIKNDNKCIKKRFEENDGIIFYNQDKVVYNSIKQKGKEINSANSKSQNITQDFSHKQIFEIVQDIKKDSAYVRKNSKFMDHKAPNKKVINNKNSKLNYSNEKKSKIKSVFEVLN